MKKSGFTLVELLGVIVILALLMTIAIPGVISMSTKIQGNMFCTKVENIEKAAQLWGDDHYDEINSKSNKTMTIKVSQLIQKGYLKKDDDKTEDVNKMVIDPRDDSSLMDKNINVMIRNSRIYASYDYGNETDKKLCTE